MHALMPSRRRCRDPLSDDSGSTSSLELMALTPMLALLVLFILWSGRAARAELVTSLAAQEAAVAAALCCNDGLAQDPGSVPPGTPDDSAWRREQTAAAVLDTKPGLDYLCLGSFRPSSDADGFTAETVADLTHPDSPAEHVERVRVVTTHVVCEADGATVPVRGLFGTRTLHGHGTHVAVLAPPRRGPGNGKGAAP